MVNNGGNSDSMVRPRSRKIGRCIAPHKVQLLPSLASIPGVSGTPEIRRLGPGPLAI